MAPPSRDHGRAPDAIRDVAVIPGFITHHPGSVLYQAGRTRVICAVGIESGTPSWLADGEGWLTAEYSLLPYATEPRSARARDGRIDGRSQEIQRLIGRSLRGSIDRHRIPGYTIQVDCDVLEADGGTRTAAISGATIALGLAIRSALDDGRFATDPRIATVVAVSVGLVGGTALLDLDYSEDHRADVDLNVVGTPEGSLVEVQGTSESVPVAQERWLELTGLATRGLTAVGQAIGPWLTPIG